MNADLVARVAVAFDHIQRERAPRRSWIDIIREWVAGHRQVRAGVDTA